MNSEFKKNNQVLSDWGDLKGSPHIELARWPDLVLVAPATANIISSVANGLAADLAQTLLMATTKQIVFAPSMNVRMWENKLFQKNIKLQKLVLKQL